MRAGPENTGSVRPSILRSRRISRRRVNRLSPGLLLAMVFLGVTVICAIAGPALTPHDPRVIDLDIGLMKPDSNHWLGTDELGRDVLSRVMAGARSALLGAALIAVGTTLLAAVFGVLAGYVGGRLDTLIGRGVDIMYALPGLLIAIIVVGVLGGGYATAILVLLLLNAPQDLRVVRAVTLEQRALPYVEAARTLGLSKTRIMGKHIWPNVVPVVLAGFFIRFSFSLVDLSTLSFLGLGVPPGAPDWGRMLSEGRDLIFDNPSVPLAPALAIVLTAVSVNLLGDWAYDRLRQRTAQR